MTERTVTIKLGIDGGAQASAMLADIIKQRDALLSRSKVNLRLDPSGMEQARRAAAEARVQQAAAMRDLSALSAAITSKAVAPMAQYQEAVGAALQATRAIGAGMVSVLRGASGEFQRQRTLAQFWGVSGYLNEGIRSFRGSITSFVAGGGAGFTNWLKNASSSLAGYRTALAGAAAVLVGMGAAAGLSAKHSKNYIESTLESGLMSRKLSDKEGARAWIEQAQGTDWSAGRDARMGVFQTVLSKNPYMNQEMAQQSTEGIEKYFFANQEMLQKKGIQSAEDLASRVSAPVMSGEDATIFEDIFGLGTSRMTAQARLLRVSHEAKDIDMDKAVAMRPDEVLTKRLTATTQAMGDAVLPALNSILGGFLKISDAIGKIPGLGKALGWGAVLTGAAAAGLTVVSMLGSLIPGLLAAGKALQVVALAAKGLGLAAAANPIGIAIIAVAGLVAGLYMLEKRFGVVTKAWNALKQSNFAKGLSEIVKGGGGLKMGLEILAQSSPGFKLISLIADTLKRLWLSSDSIKKLFSTGLSLWQKIADFFSWLVNAVKAGVQWIKDGLGITKAEKKAEMGKVAEREGLHWNENKQAWIKTASGVETAPSAMLMRAQAEYDKAPESVFSKIGEVIAGTMTNIKKLFDPVLNPLSEAIKSLVEWIQKLPGMGGGNEPAPDVITNPETGEGLQGSTVTTPGVSSGSGGLTTPRQFVPPEAPATPPTFPAMAVGGSIIGSGLIRAHSGEEVTPANVVTGAQTTLERISEMISGRTGGASGPITITAPPVTINIGRVDKDVDVDRLFAKAGEEFDRKLLFRLRNGLNVMGLRDIGYMRG